MTEFSSSARCRKYRHTAQKSSKNEYCLISTESDISEGENRSKIRVSRAAFWFHTFSTQRNMTQQKKTPAITNGSRRKNSEFPRRLQDCRNRTISGGCAVVILARYARLREGWGASESC